MHASTQKQTGNVVIKKIAKMFSTHCSYEQALKHFLIGLLQTREFP